MTVTDKMERRTLERIDRENEKNAHELRIKYRRFAADSLRHLKTNVNFGDARGVVFWAETLALDLRRAREYAVHDMRRR